jgi:type IV secretory pathway VirB10-like protein
MSEEYEDEFPTEPGVPEALTPSAPGAPSIFRTVDRRLGPIIVGVVALGACGVFWVMHSSSQPMAATAEAHTPVLDTRTSFRLPAPSPSPVAIAPSPLPTLRPTPSPPPAIPPAPQVAPPAAPRTPSPEEVFAAEERQRVLEARRAPSRVAFDNDAQSLAQQTAADTQSLAQGSQVRAGGGSIAQGPHAQFIAQQGGAPGYIPQTAQYELRRGTVINANWATTLDSTLPGGVLVARVSQNVYDSVTHSVLVLPAGSILTGQGDSQTVAGEARYLCAFDEVELPYPDSRKFYLGSNPGSGRQGENGASVGVDTHAGRTFGNAVLYSLLQAGVNAATRASSTVVNLGTSNMGLQQPQQPAPTFHAYVGQPLTIIVARDLPFDAFRSTP